MTDWDDVEPLLSHIQKLEQRVHELEEAIRRHKAQFYDEALAGERELWAHLKRED